MEPQKIEKFGGCHGKETEGNRFAVEKDNEVVSARDVRIGGTRYEHQKENATWNR